MSKNTDNQVVIAPRDLFSVERCPLDYYCAKTWDELDRTENPNVAFCKECSSDVYMCDTVEEFDVKAAEGVCVAYRILEAGSELIIDSPLGLPKRP
jgi:hypothetical protein